MLITGNFYYTYNYNTEIIKKINNFGLISKFNIINNAIETYENDIKYENWCIKDLSNSENSHFLIINFEQKLFLNLRRDRKEYIDIIQSLSAKNIRVLKIEKLL